MSKTAIGVFSSEHDAEQAVGALRHAGFGDSDISVIGPDRGRAGQTSHNSYNNQHVGDGATWGAGIGGAAGLLATAGVLAIPGIGPLLAMGPLAATLTAAAGGGLAGALIDFGVPEKESKEYQQEVKSGKFLTVVKTDGDVHRAADCLRQQGASDVHCND